MLPSLADGLVGNLDPETITFDLVRRHVAGIVTVAEEQIASAIAKLVAEERVIAEGACGDRCCRQCSEIGYRSRVGESR